MTCIGGANDIGSVFKIKIDGSGYLNLVDFAGTTNGCNHMGPLFMMNLSLWNGTVGGIYLNQPDCDGYGLIFKIKPMVQTM